MSCSRVSQGLPGGLGGIEGPWVPAAPGQRAVLPHERLKLQDVSPKLRCFHLGRRRLDLEARARDASGRVVEMGQLMLSILLPRNGIVEVLASLKFAMFQLNGLHVYKLPMNQQ